MVGRGGVRSVRVGRGDVVAEEVRSEIVCDLSLGRRTIGIRSGNVMSWVKLGRGNGRSPMLGRSSPLLSRRRSKVRLIASSFLVFCLCRAASSFPC